MSEHDRAEGLTSGQLQAAEADLTRIRESVAAAGRDELAASELIDALRAYLDRHGPAFRRAATAVGEELRRQLLEQLYQWRTQVQDQLGRSRGPLSVTLKEPSGGADRSEDQGPEA